MIDKNHFWLEKKTTAANPLHCLTFKFATFKNLKHFTFIVIFFNKSPARGKVDDVKSQTNGFNLRLVQLRFNETSWMCVVGKIQGRYYMMPHTQKALSLIYCRKYYGRFKLPLSKKIAVNCECFSVAKIKHLTRCRYKGWSLVHIKKILSSGNSNLAKSIESVRIKARTNFWEFIDAHSSIITNNSWTFKFFRLLPRFGPAKIFGTT